jgi:hypothetical protein
LPRLVIGVGSLCSRLRSSRSWYAGVCVGNYSVVDMTGWAGLLHLLEINRIGTHLTRFLINQSRYVQTRRDGPGEPEGSERPIAGVRNLVERLRLAILFFWRGIPNTGDKKLAGR